MRAYPANDNADTLPRDLFELPCSELIVIGKLREPETRKGDFAMYRFRLVPNTGKAVRTALAMMGGADNRETARQIYAKGPVSRPRPKLVTV